MGKILENFNNSNDLKKLNTEEKVILAQELRDMILDTVSKNGGHLASNLGIVELTIALHSCFNLPEDKIIWDVGHQSYVHKILSGRKNEFNTLRQLGGIAGFPRTSESEYDAFDTGHSSTSISVALGMAEARDIKEENNKIIAVIGDGALTGGMALEALNDAGNSASNVIVILNDNEMSISKNVGGISRFLTKLRTRKWYTRANIKAKKVINKIPYIGTKFVKLVQRIKRSIKQVIIPKMYFEDIGFKYLGPVDGHNIERLESILNVSKQIDGPILIHVITKKGKGYKFAEENPDKFHSTSKFNLETGEKEGGSKKDYSKVMGNKLTEIAEYNKNVVAITAAMQDGTGLKGFAEKFPKRIFDVGIAEQHAIGMAAGMAKNGIIPVVPIYSSFLQRAYDQLVHDVCLQELPVVICVDRAGIVGNDGETHQGTLDVAFLSTIPNMNIMAPKNFEELEKMLEFAVELKKTIAIRYPRGGESKEKFENCKDIEYGKAEILKEGKDVTIIGSGKTVARAMELSRKLEEDKIKTEVINVRFIKPLDKETILNSAMKTKKVIIIEDNIYTSSISQNVQSLIMSEGLNNIKVFSYTYPDEYIKHGSVSEIEKSYGLDVQSIYDSYKEKIAKQNKLLVPKEGKKKKEKGILSKIKDIFTGKGKEKKNRGKQ